MLITLSVIGSSLLLSYYYRKYIVWNSIKLYTYINKLYNKKNNKNIIDDIIIDDIIYIEYNDVDLTEKVLYKIINKDLKIIDNNFIEINNEKIDINKINIINSKSNIISLKEYLYIY